MWFTHDLNTALHMLQVTEEKTHYSDQVSQHGTQH